MPFIRDSKIEELYHSTYGGSTLHYKRSGDFLKIFKENKGEYKLWIKLKDSQWRSMCRYIYSGLCDDGDLTDDSFANGVKFIYSSSKQKINLVLICLALSGE